MNYIDSKIIKMRKDNSYLKNILTWTSRELPNIDELICLCRVVRVLKENNFKIEVNEITNAFNKFYNRNFHENKSNYLTYLYNLANVGQCPEKNTAFYSIKSEKIVDLTNFNSDSNEIYPFVKITSQNGDKILNLEVLG